MPWPEFWKLLGFVTAASAFITLILIVFTP